MGQPKNGNILSASYTYAEFRGINITQNIFEFALSLVGLNQSRIVDGFVVDGIHPADSAVGVIGGNGPGGFFKLLDF